MRAGISTRELARTLSVGWSTREDRGFEVRRRIGRTYVGISKQENAVLLIPLDASELPTGKTIGNVRVAFHQAVTFDIDEKTWEQPAGVVECLDSRLLPTFCVLVRDVADKFQRTSSSPKEVLEALRSWDELLRRRGRLNDRDEEGLWGELALLRQLPKPDSAVAAWHGPLRDTVDFFGGGVALECKTSFRRQRHHVSHRQASYEGHDVQPYLVSLWLQTDAVAGRTLPDLVDEVAKTLQDEDSFRLKLLRAGFRDTHRDEYQRRFRLLDRWIFPMESVPRIREFDPGVHEIRYEVDLSGIAPIAGSDGTKIMKTLVGDD